MAADQQLGTGKQATGKFALIGQRRAKGSRHAESGIEQVDVAERARCQGLTGGAPVRSRAVVGNEGRRQARIARQKSACEEADALSVIGQRWHIPRQGWASDE